MNWVHTLGGLCLFITREMPQKSMNFSVQIDVLNNSRKPAIEDVNNHDKMNTHKVFKKCNFMHSLYPSIQFYTSSDVLKAADSFSFFLFLCYSLKGSVHEDFRKLRV